MKVKRTITCASALLALSSSFGAGAAEQEAKPVAVGAATEAILKMQREGTAAGQTQPIAGEVATRSYQRYLESFTQPIPQNNQPVTPGSKSAVTGSRQ